MGTIYQARGTWYVRYFEDRLVNGTVQHVRVARQIAPITTRGKRPPRGIEDQASVIVKEACVLNSTPERVLTIGDFVEQVYLPWVEHSKRLSTLKGYRDIWQNHFCPRCSSD